MGFAQHCNNVGSSVLPMKDVAPGACKIQFVPRLRSPICCLCVVTLGKGATSTSPLMDLKSHVGTIKITRVHCASASWSSTHAAVRHVDVLWCYQQLSSCLLCRPHSLHNPTATVCTEKLKSCTCPQHPSQPVQKATMCQDAIKHHGSCVAKSNPDIPAVCRSLGFIQQTKRPSTGKYWGATKQPKGATRQVRGPNRLPRRVHCRHSSKPPSQARGPPRQVRAPTKGS